MLKNVVCIHILSLYNLLMCFFGDSPRGYFEKSSSIVNEVNNLFKIFSHLKKCRLTSIIIIFSVIITTANFFILTFHSDQMDNRNSEFLSHYAQSSIMSITSRTNIMLHTSNITLKNYPEANLSKNLKIY